MKLFAKDKELNHNRTKAIAILVGGLLIAGMIGCSGATPTAAPTSAPPTIAVATDVPVPAATDAPTTAPTTASQATSAPAATNTTAATEPTAASTNSNETVTLTIVSDKSEARYRVREQLAGVNLPSDAVGKTNAVTGQIVGHMDGTIDAANSKIVVDIRTLKSDQFPRDGFIQRTPLESSTYPNVTFVPKSAPGLPLIPPVPTSGTFQLIGDLTIKDVTKPVTWDATCTLESNQAEGTCNATTSFTFADFNLEQPRVGRVLSIEDTIKLEIDLYLRRTAQ